MENKKDRINDYRGTKILLAFIGAVNVCMMVIGSLPHVNLFSTIVQAAFVIFLYLGVRWVRILFIIGTFAGFFVGIGMMLNPYLNSQYSTAFFIVYECYTAFTFAMLVFNQHSKAYFESKKKNKKQKNEMVDRSREKENG